MEGKRCFAKSRQYTLYIPCGSKILSKSVYLAPFQDKCVFALYAEIQNGRQKWRENNFWEKSLIQSADNLRVKNLVEIALSCSVSKVNALLYFIVKYKVAEQHVLGKYSNCNSFGVTMDLLNSHNFKVAITQLCNVQQA